MAVNETAAVTTVVYNTDGIPMDPSTYQIVYSSDNEQVAAVSSDGKVSGKALGTANITAKASQGDITVEKTIQITVASQRTLFQDNFESYTDGPIDAAQIGAYQVSNLQIEPMDSTHPQKGLSGLFNGGDVNWQGKNAGYVIYKLDSADPSGFKKLTISYSGRALNIPAVGANGKVIFSVGADPANLQEVGQMPQNGNMASIQSLDVTSAAVGQKTVYLKVYIDPGRFTWAFLDSIKVDEFVLN